MKQIPNKEYEKYQQYQTDKLHGRILTPDGLRVVCAGLDNNPDKIGIHMLEMLAKFKSEGLFDIIRRIKTELSELHISMKINHSDEMAGGLTERQSLETCRLCAAAGLDSIEVSGNGSSAPGIRAGVNESYYKSFALRLADEVDIPVILVGGNRSIESMEHVLNEGNIEFMSLSRPLIREPDLPKRWVNGDMSPAKCVSCNMCYQMPWQECIFNIKEQRGI